MLIQYIGRHVHSLYTLAAHAADEYELFSPAAALSPYIPPARFAY